MHDRIRPIREIHRDVTPAKMRLLVCNDWHSIFTFLILHKSRQQNFSSTENRYGHTFGDVHFLIIIVAMLFQLISIYKI